MKRNIACLSAGIGISIVLFLFGVGCSTVKSSNQPTGGITLNASSTPTRVQSIIGDTAIPSATVTPSATATPMPTPTPSAIETPFPMSILAERQMTYPGSEITIEETLEPGANYYRYLAWYESQGLKIYGLLTVPFGEKPATGWPAIVFNHGYIPPQEYRTTERYVAYVDRLARSGYIVYKIDYRGHDRSEGFAGGAYGDPGYTTDVLNAVSSLKNFSQADPNRIGMWGHSMGGFLTLRAMVISKDIKAGVIWAGVVGSYPDLICCWRLPTPGVPTPTPNANFRSGWRTIWQQLYGTPAEDLAFWNEISSNSYLSDLSGPVQLHHGTADTEVPIKFSETLYGEIQAAGKTVEFYSYPGDNHNLSDYFSLAMQRTIEFFDRYVKNR
jgi:uncharacterized protein